MNSNSEDTVKIGELTIQLDKLDNQLMVLETSLNVLRTKLIPVCRDMDIPVGVEPGQVAVPSIPPIPARVRCLYDRVEIMCTILQIIHDRLEL